MLVARFVPKASSCVALGVQVDQQCFGPGAGEGGEPEEARGRAEEYDVHRLQELNELLARETGQSVEKVQSDSDRNFWMTAEEALEYGLVSRIVEHANEIG